jgi:two-component system chemotaxis response regulator CheB
MQKIVVIGGSAGSIDALKVILGGLPQDFAAAVLVVIHIGARESILPSLLERCTPLTVRHAIQGEPIVAGRVLVAPADLHLTVARDGERAYVRLTHGPKENHLRPAIDPLFRSVAVAYRANAIAVVLSGFLDDGTVGLQAIKACNGIAVVQDPADAAAADMPASAVQHTTVDFVRPVQDIAPTLVELVNRTATVPDAPADRAGTELQAQVAIENRMFDEGADMSEMDRIGTRASLTCPECGGAIWQVRQASPVRYRCHTGHAFTARVLESLQDGETEEALWAGVRALHEQEQLYRQLYQTAGAQRSSPLSAGDPRNEYLIKAERAKEQAQLLRELISTRMRLGVP